jgi:DNA-binding CsgD family transcriptional regulator
LPLSRRYLFEDFIEQASKAKTLDELFALFLAVVASYGYDRVNFSIIHDLEIPYEYWVFGLFTTYPLQWMNYYADKRFALHDPVLERAAWSGRPFWWQEVGRDAQLTRHQRDIMKQAAEANLHHGFGMPLIGPNQQLAGVALATSVKTAVPYRNSPLLAAICRHFYECVKNLVGHETPLAPNRSKLSNQQVEVLIYLSHYRTDAEIGALMRLKENTVNGYIRRIFDKLGVNNRQAAVDEARRRGIIPSW